MPVDNVKLVPHSKAQESVDCLLKYVQQHPESTPADVMLFRRWQDIISKSQLSSKRQTKLIEFLKME